MDIPYVICHMLSSIDGKVTGDFLYSAQCAPATDVYYEINRGYRADAFACGRITMEGSFTGGYYPELTKYDNLYSQTEDHIVECDKKFFAVAFDPHGRLGWKSGVIEDPDPGYGGAHIIEVLTEDIDPRFACYLRDVGASYIYAGRERIDLNLALSKLRRLFGIQTLLLEGGSIINGAFAVEGLIDEVSLVIAPVVASTGDKPLFMNSRITDFTLSCSQTYDGDILWLNYKKINQD